MMNQTLFSVIIPTFNREIFLLDAVRSAVNVSPGNTETIVVNDGDKLLESPRCLIPRFDGATGSLEWK
jgi:hypothetical protein